MLRKKSSLPAEPTNYPAGSFIKTEKGLFYILNSQKRLRVISKRVLDSWSPQRLIETTEAAVEKYRISSKIKFRNGSIIWSLGDNKYYFIEGGKRRQIKSPDVFDRLGIDLRKKDQVLVVSEEEVNLHEPGEDLT